jgi:hypothetical protein
MRATGNRITAAMRNPVATRPRTHHQRVAVTVTKSFERRIVLMSSNPSRMVDEGPSLVGSRNHRVALERANRIAALADRLLRSLAAARRYKAKAGDFKALN